MDTVTQDAIIGIDVSRDWLDIHCLPHGERRRFPNSTEGHAQFLNLAEECVALVCFEATGGQEWKLWAALDTAGNDTRQLPPAQIKAFAASQGTGAKTDRIDAELIALFMAFRPDAGRALPHKKIRLSEPWCQNAVSLWKHASGLSRRLRRMGSWDQLSCLRLWTPN